MSDKVMIITEAIVLLLAIGAVLSGAYHHLFFVVGMSILFGVHTTMYKQQRKSNGKSFRQKNNIK